ncbi:hypothetical protein KAR91_82120 [Candidatus Pacearchaeota archaeon]|nr:hypothetical protein [Candidatus Pacearchaeota archaeon]
MPTENPTSSMTPPAPKPPSKWALWAKAREEQAGSLIERTATSVRDNVSSLVRETFKTEDIDSREAVKSVLFTGSLATAAVTGTIL